MPSAFSPGPDLEDRLRRLYEIGIALSVERDLNVLLERILEEARRFTAADAGTLYLVKGNQLTFEIAQNDTLKAFAGGLDIPPVPLDRESVSGYAAVTGQILNIEDVYTDRQYSFEGPRSYDRLTGYRTRSVLVVPMQDHEGQVIGILQLFNATDPVSGEVVAFTKQDEALLRSLASQAAVAIDNVRLIQETEVLFESFVKAMATALDERSPYTGGHVRRVTELAMVVAQAVNACRQGPLAGVSFSSEMVNELRIASWMHDIGKITTPEWVIDKPTKLTTICDRIELLRTRFSLLCRTIEVEMLQRLLAGEALERIESERRRRLAEVNDELAFLERINQPGEWMADEDLEHLQQLARKRFTVDGEEHSWITADELENLSIRKGSLTEAERQKINGHAEVTIKMLEQIPFTRKLRQIPAIAGAHHEKLDGSGYPRGMEAAEISLQARILALVDIFDSLSAEDRPYRSAMSPEKVLEILRKEAAEGRLDADLWALFIDQKLYLKLHQIKAPMAQDRAPTT